MLLRQEITPDHLLGRVTSAFWTITAAPGPLGAALVTALTQYLGAATVSAIIGGLGMLVVGIGIFTPIRQKHPERVVLGVGEGGREAIVSEPESLFIHGEKCEMEEGNAAGSALFRR